MKFIDGGADLPEALLRSLTEDQLVVFVGAGASARAYPRQHLASFYPDFAGLTNEIASRLHRDLSERDRELIKSGLLDRLLGEWDDHHGDVRQHAADILSENESSKRISLHRAIVRLFAGKTPRIVTTNFDRLFLRALASEGLEHAPQWKTWTAPALFPAKRLEGICLLHGSVTGPKDMVLTDKDIGRAYMEEGWALRFAHEMFRSFDVLFVGYRLEDPPLRYLTLALEGGSQRGRWALVPEPKGSGARVNDERDWERRHVHPIWYPAHRRDYRALEKTIREWGNDNSKSFIDRGAVLNEYARSNPLHLKPHELDRVRYFLHDPSSLRDFVRAASAIEWFDQLRAWGHFNYLLRSEGAPNEATPALLDQLVHWVISHREEFVGRLVDDRNTIHPVVFSQFCRAFAKDPENIDGTSIGRILEFLRPSITRTGAVSQASLSLTPLLNRLLRDGREDDALWLVSRLLDGRSIASRRPGIAYQVAKSQGQSTDGFPEHELHFEVVFEDQLSDYLAKGILTSVLAPRVKELGLKVPNMLLQKFLQLRTIENRIGRVAPSNYRRAAIEPHAQDAIRRDAVNALLNLLRDYWDESLKADRAMAYAVYQSWAGISDPLIERLRLYALTHLVGTTK